MKRRVVYTRAFTIFFSSFLIIILINYFELISYGFQQGYGQMQVLWNAQAVEEILTDPDFPDSLKSRIKLIDEAKEYAVRLGLQSNDSYTTLFDQKGEPVLWNLSACRPYSFEPYTWTFPFTGKVSYKGYFDRKEARAAEIDLKQQGYDTRIRTVTAWSTLGWFKDPIMSNMLYRKEGDLVETIFHELVHQTIFFRDSIEFNENLASFIGKEATLLFLTAAFGESSGELSEYLTNEEDSRKFRNHILRGKSKLETLYQSFTPSMKENEKEFKKDSMISVIITKLDSISFKNSRYNHLFKEGNLPNNAYFMAFSRYHEKSDTLRVIYKKKNENLTQFIQLFKNSQN